MRLVMHTVWCRHTTGAPADNISYTRRDMYQRAFFAQGKARCDRQREAGRFSEQCPSSEVSMDHKACKDISSTSAEDRMRVAHQKELSSLPEYHYPQPAVRGQRLRVCHSLKALHSTESDDSGLRSGPLNLPLGLQKHLTERQTPSLS